ncbi:nicotinate phosphoribosyltransferase [Coemansia reversa NRRL 1564]|uniref:Nicotinate phosphoribosyltransferase n=1 Tax=Coemansia reversa (strain ATCC 12441 / NRRL 1564) TaxID=763665 RepID=A0A2G5BKJ8_COERN|nr:nicotinate phosphoribosyltransferase [Coemansia reversa NRRL 1564]|eukprot:PIA19554.1 nicotinate phosphoribosyltransferase [Coemansia reversa NRRL 1564]
MTPIENQTPFSILDQDLYKFCMQQAVLEHYSDVVVNYSFINRDPSMRFSKSALSMLQRGIEKMAQVIATKDELEYLQSTCPYLSDKYIQYLASYRFNPLEEIKCSLNEKTGILDLKISGKWCQTILYEVPLLALISESYYRNVDTDWNYNGQHENIMQKGTMLAKAGCNFSEFGTRRRRDFKTQDIVMSGLAMLPADYTGRCTGTSNVYLARKYGVTPVGTVGHEWTMGVAALEGTYENGNSLALQKWYSTFKGNLGIALTDTFGTKAFFANFNHELASKYDGVRHDSGNPYDFITRVYNHYKQLGIDPSTKMVVFSDGLCPTKAIDIKKHCDRFSLKCLFGIGTNFTNDFHCASDPSVLSKAPNFVIKLLRCNEKPCVKLSDDKTKHAGDNAEVAHAQNHLTELGLF